MGFAGRLVPILTKFDDNMESSQLQPKKLFGNI